MFKRRYPKKFESLWQANYHEKSSFVVPSNKMVAWTVRPNVPDQVIFDCGITHIAFNDGKQPKSASSKGAIFISNAQFLKVYSQQHLGGIPLRQFTKSNCEAAVAQQIAERGGPMGIVTTGASETNPALADWGQEFDGSHGNIPVQDQYHWIDRAWADQLGPNGYYFGDYDGVGTATNKTAAGDIEALRAGFQSDQGAWNYMSLNTPFGNPGFTGGGWEYRHILVKTYWDGYTDPKLRIFGMSTDMLFSRKALNYKGSNKKVLSFPFAGQTEFRNRLQAYKRQVGGGTALNFAFCQNAQELNTIIGAISMIIADAIFNWQDNVRNGNDPNIVAKNVDQYNGSATKATQVFYEYTTGQNVGYPAYWDVGHNAMLTGVEMYCAAVAWASNSISYAPSKVQGGVFNVDNSEYLINTYKANQPVGYRFKSGNRRALLAYDLNGLPGTQKTYFWDCDGEIVELKMTVGVPYLLLGEIA